MKHITKLAIALTISLASITNAVEITSATHNSQNLNITELCDNNCETGITTQQGTYTFNIDTTEEIVFVDLYIIADTPGTAIIKLDDIMALKANYTTEPAWIKKQIPFSNATTLELTFETPGATLAEIRISPRTPIDSTWPTSNVIADNISISLDVEPTSTCDVPLGYMCNFFSQGIIQGITDPISRPEFIQKFQEAGVDGFRYPGGTMCYGYPPTEEAVQVYIDAGVVPYGLRDRSDWSSPQDFLQFCKDAGTTAWYEIDPGYWYDRENKTVHQIMHWDRAGNREGTAAPANSPEYLDQAVADAAAFAQYADELGVDVVWEIGNEDYCHFTGETFARICVAFSEAIRAVVPSAKICIIGDGLSWSDYSWADELVAALAEQGMGEVNYSSRHCYLNGGGGTTPQEIGQGGVDFWRRAIQYQYTLDRWNDAGFATTQQAMTEFNRTSGGLCRTPHIEHSVGRALGDAQLVTELFRSRISIFFHDLVRDDSYGTFFARLDYYPENPAGSRYHWYPEGAASALTAVHGHGNIVLNGAGSNHEGVTISRHRDFAYITVVNLTENYKEVAVNLEDVTIDKTRTAELSTFRAANPDCCFFDYYCETSTVANQDENISLQAYPFSVTALKVYLQ